MGSYFGVGVRAPTRPQATTSQQKEAVVRVFVRAKPNVYNRRMTRSGNVMNCWK